MPAAPPTPSAPEIDRLAPAARPGGTPAGYQTWRDLTFLHWRVPAGVVADKLPAGLEVDTFGGDAWVGLVPFLMTGVRPRWFVPVPGVSTFRETNVRTYVTCRTDRGGREPGVYFFSLDADAWPAVLVARRVWRLPYFRASMALTKRAGRITYETRRVWPGPRGAGGRVAVTPVGDTRAAEPGTLDHFLAERYLLFTPGPGGTLLRGRVHHTPYPLRACGDVAVDDTLTAAAGCDVAGPPDHACYSPGVDVTIYPLRPAG